MSVIDGNTNTVIATIPIGSNVYGLSVDPDKNLIYATENQTLGKVAVIDGSTNTVIGTYDAGNVPIGVGVLPA